MAKLTIVADIHAHRDKIDLVKSELLKLIPITRAEKGCIGYDLYQDKEAATHFMLFEVWESRALLQEHKSASHLTAYMAATKGAVAQFTLTELSPLA